MHGGMCVPKSAHTLLDMAPNISSPLTSCACVFFPLELAVTLSWYRCLILCFSSSDSSATLTESLFGLYKKAFDFFGP